MNSITKKPWGYFEILESGNKFLIKKIIVKPGGILSLQSHKHRSEHWVVVEGSAKTTLNNKIKILNKGQSIYIPLGAIHRLENKEDKPIILIEIWGNEKRRQENMTTSSEEVIDHIKNLKYKLVSRFGDNYIFLPEHFDENKKIIRLKDYCPSQNN